jgi:hypothetical protein
MERPASPLLAARTTERGAPALPTLPGQAEPAAVESVAPGSARRGRLRRLLAGFGDSCALAAVALLGCLVVVAVGTIGSLLWMLLLER